MSMRTSATLWGWLGVIALCVLGSRAALVMGEGLSPMGRPFRAGIEKWDRGLDSLKPIGHSDVAGVLFTDDLRIGLASDEWLTAVSRESGRRVWWYSLPALVAGPLALFRDSLVVALRDGRVLRIGVQSGEDVWKEPLSVDSFVERRPVLLDGVLYVVSAAQILYAIDYATGKVRWIYDAGFPDELVVRGGVVPVGYRGYILLGTANGELHALEASSGKLQWRDTISVSQERFRAFVGDFIVQDDRLVFLRQDGRIGSLDMSQSDRPKVWMHTVDPITASAFRDGRLFVGYANGKVEQYDVRDGHRAWRAEVHVPVGYVVPGEQGIYSVGSNGRIVALSPSDGSALWYDDVGAEVSASPFVAGPFLYLPTGLRVLYRYWVQQARAVGSERITTD